MKKTLAALIAGATLLGTGAIVLTFHNQPLLRPHAPVLNHPASWSDGNEEYVRLTNGYQYVFVHERIGRGLSGAVLGESPVEVDTDIDGDGQVDVISFTGNWVLAPPKITKDLWGRGQVVLKRTKELKPIETGTVLYRTNDFDRRKEAFLKADQRLRRGEQNAVTLPPDLPR